MTYTREIAKITETFLGFEDGHGLFTANLTVTLDGSTFMAVGGQYAFGEGEQATGFGLRFIQGLLGAAGVPSWEKLVGRTVYVLTDDDGRAVGLENLPTEPGRRFVFAELAAEYRSRKG